ncbi:MAG TPA: hypothetical protein VI814_00635 [Candidatus Limnocylindria bacterium]
MRLAPTADAREMLADAKALEANGADALWVDAADADPYVALGAIAAVTWRPRLIAAGAPDGDGRTTCDALARGRLSVAEELAASGERWIHAAFPDGIEAWQSLRRDAIASGATGIVIPYDERVVDLLRNPDVVADRSDLNLATG